MHTCACMRVCACVCVHVCVWGTPTLLSTWDLTAEPQDLPGAEETRDRDCGTRTGAGAEATLLTALPQRGAWGGWVSEPGWRAASGLTHITCRPSCCTPRAGSSDTPSTPAWWAPRRRTLPGLRWRIWGQKTREQVVTAWHTQPVSTWPWRPRDLSLPSGATF